MATIEFSGFDELEHRLNDLKRRADELDGENEVPFSQLFPESFMQEYTSFSSFDEMLSSGGFNVESQEDFDAIPDDVFDRHVVSTTKFSGWEEMLGEATSQYVAGKLGF